MIRTSTVLSSVALDSGNPCRNDGFAPRRRSGSDPGTQSSREGGRSITTTRCQSNLPPDP